MGTSNRDSDTRHIVEILATCFPKVTFDCTRQVTTGDFMIGVGCGLRISACELTSDQFKHEGWQGILAEKISTWIYQGAI